MDHALDPDSSRYQVLDRIGRGGMAEVLLAATQSSGVTKLAVLKCLWPDLAEDPELVEMFQDEARLSARLAHPNLVQTYELVRHGGRLAIAMEYVDGQPLKGVLRRLPGGALTLPARLHVVAGVLAGLEHAHGLTDLDGTPLGVVHRDVSPHNVLVTYDGHVKLLDFGIAKAEARLHQTRPGNLKGKLGYLAPEAIRGDDVDARADIFSVGVVLWELLAGQRMWGRSSESELGWRLTCDAQPPELPPELDVPGELRDVCMRALSPDPDDRHQTAAELQADLEPFAVEGSASQARRLGRHMRHAFEAERRQRQVLIDRHLRRAGEAELGYASYELIVREVAAAPSVRPRQRGRSLAFAAAATLVLVATAAVGVGAHLGRQALAWASVPAPGPSSSSRTALPDPSPFAAGDVVAAASPVTQPLPAARESVASGRHEHRARAPRGARARLRPLDLLSDDVLGLDGEPLAAPATPTGRSP